MEDALVVEAAATPPDGDTILNALARWLSPEGSGRLVGREMHALADLAGEVRNGGFDQYFANSSGDGWRDARAGAVRVGDAAAIAAIDAACAPFGAIGPSVDRAARQQQLERLGASATAQLDDSDRAWYRDDEARSAAIAHWYLAHHRELPYLRHAAKARRYSVEVITDLDDPPVWAESVESAPLRDRRRTSTGRQGTFMLRQFAGSYFWDGPDHLFIVLVDAQEKRLPEILDVLGRLHAIVLLRCLIVGDAPVDLPAWSTRVANSADAARAAVDAAVSADVMPTQEAVSAGSGTSADPP